MDFLSFAKSFTILQLYEPQKPRLCKTLTLAGHELCMSPPHSNYELFNPMQLGLKASEATWPPQWRDGARLRLCFSFNGLTGCVQGPGVNLFSGCSMLGSLGKEKR